MKTVYLLIGLKGSGKSYIGNLIENELEIKFLNVEKFFINFLDNPDKLDEKENIKVWKKIEEKIEKELKEINQISLESVGIFNSFKNFLEKINTRYQVKLIKVETPLDLCHQRINKRDKNDQVKLSLDSVEKMNNLFLKEKYNYNLVIKNENWLDFKIIKEFKSIAN
jgi:predicted kinase